MFDKWFEIEEQEYSEDDAEWDAFVAAHPHGSVLQTTDWAKLKGFFGWTTQRVWVRREGKLVGGAQILFRSLAMGLAKIGYVPHGPLVDWEHEEVVSVLLNQIDWAAYQRGAGMVKMEPYLWQSDVGVEAWAAICAAHDSHLVEESIQPPRTVVVDLRPSEDDILAAMKSKTRYNIRLSGRKGVTVRQGTAADVPMFNQMMMVTSRRDGFAVHAPDYYRKAFELFAPDRAAMFIAEYEERPLATLMVFALGRQAAYLYGASSNEERQRMPTYAIQWAAIQWAKERGCEFYDLWGVPDHPFEALEDQFTERSDGLWGVYRFKRGFGGEVKRTVGPVDRIYNKRLHRLYTWWRSR